MGIRTWSISQLFTYELWSCSRCTVTKTSQIALADIVAQYLTYSTAGGRQYEYFKLGLLQGARVLLEQADVGRPYVRLDLVVTSEASGKRERSR